MKIMRYYFDGIDALMRVRCIDGLTDAAIDGMARRPSFFLLPFRFLRLVPLDFLSLSLQAAMVIYRICITLMKRVSAAS